MKLFDKYSINGNFTNYSLESMLKDFNIAPELINELLIRNSISSLTKEFIEKLKQIDEKEDLTNLLLQFFLLADKMKPITCNKLTLAKLTGLTERQIDERRRANVIPSIQLTGSSNDKGGRRIILFDPYVVTTVLKKFEIKRGNYHAN
ncbi:MAG: hypothetical protein PHS65_06340 [Arcobacteraceae bacterium]|nr:hypothetical protein [Arcobacteraceae bacterium]